MYMIKFLSSRKFLFAILTSLLLLLGSKVAGSNFSALSLALVGLYTAFAGANTVAGHLSSDAVQRPTDTVTVVSTTPVDGSK